MRRNKLVNSILDTQEKVDKITSELGDMKLSISEKMDNYFEFMTKESGILVSEIKKVDFEQLSEFFSKINKTIEDIKTSESPADKDRLENIEKMLSEILNDGKVPQERLEVENSYRKIVAEEAIKPMSPESAAVMPKVNKSKVLKVMGEAGSEFWNSMGRPLFRQAFGPVYDVAEEAVKWAKKAKSATSKDSGALYNYISKRFSDHSEKDEQVKILTDIRDALKDSEYKFEEKGDKQHEENMDKLTDILDWTKNFSSFLPTLFKWGAPIAIALAGYLVIKSELTDLYNELSGSWDEATPDEKEEAVAQVEQQLTNDKNALGMFGDESATGQEDIPFLSKFNRTTAQTIAWMGNKLDRLTGFGDPNKTSRSVFEGKWNPFTWIAAGIDSAFGYHYDPNYSEARSVVEDKSNIFSRWWERTASNVDYLGGENVDYATAMQGSSFLPGPQMGSRKAMEAAYLRNKPDTDVPTSWDPTITQQDVIDFSLGKNPSLANRMGIPGKNMFNFNPTPLTNNTTVITNNYSIPKLDGDTH